MKKFAWLLTSDSRSLGCPERLWRSPGGYPGGYPGSCPRQGVQGGGGHAERQE